MTLTPADVVISHFGGIRPTARVLGKDPATVSRWKHTTGLIPSNMQAMVLKKAKGDITAETLVLGHKTVGRRKKVK